MFNSRRSRNLLSLLMLCIFLSAFITDMSVIMDDTEDAPPIDFHRILGEKKNLRKHGKTRKLVRHRGKKKVAINNKNDASVEPVNDPQSHSSDAVDQTQRAIMLISFGKSAAEGTLLERCILSIRRRGQFQDAIVVITDAPADRYKGEFDDNVFVVKANEDDILYDHFKATGQKYKRFKTLLIDYFNGLVDSEPQLDQIEYLYYMDIDMMMGASFPLLARGLDKIYRTEHGDSTGDKVPKVFMFMDPHSGKFALNSGFIVINRHTSNPCLDSWKKAMDDNPEFQFDQQALNLVVESGGSTCKLIGMDSTGIVTFPASDRRLKRLMKDRRYYPLIHLFNSCFADKMSDKITKRFVAHVLLLSQAEKESGKYGKQIIRAEYSAKWKESN